MNQDRKELLQEEGDVGLLEVDDTTEGQVVPPASYIRRMTLLALTVFALAAAATQAANPQAASGTSVALDDSVSLAASKPRFCGMAVNQEKGNNFNTAKLQAAADAVGAQNLWHYNWKTQADEYVPGAEFVPMVKEPNGAAALPPAGQNGVGYTVLGWNEPDDGGQAGRNHNLLSNPAAFVRQWVQDMQTAKSKGYTEFVGPSMAHDTCWLDHFLKACSALSDCKQYVTYLGLHRYRPDCGKYENSMQFQGFREDLGYIMTFNRLREKYNQQGFNIKGLWMTEFGCLINNYKNYAPESHARNYINAWFHNTVAKVLNNDRQVISQIVTSNQREWIGENGPDASQSSYKPGTCKWQKASGYNPGVEAVRAIKSLTRVSWTTVEPGTNYFFAGNSLQSLGERYFDACQETQTPPSKAAATTAALTTSNAALTTSNAAATTAVTTSKAAATTAVTTSSAVGTTAAATTAAVTAAVTTVATTVGPVAPPVVSGFIQMLAPETTNLCVSALFLKNVGEAIAGLLGVRSNSVHAQVKCGENGRRLADISQPVPIFVTYTVDTAAEGDAVEALTADRANEFSTILNKLDEEAGLTSQISIVKMSTTGSGDIETMPQESMPLGVGAANQIAIEGMLAS